MTTPTTIPVRLQLRQDTAANWTTNNPLLLAGELGRESDTNKIKIGNGATAWVSLAYQSFGGAPGPILENQQIIGASYTLSTGYNGASAGPVTVAATYTVTVPAGAVWVII